MAINSQCKAVIRFIRILLHKDNNYTIIMHRAINSKYASNNINIQFRHRASICPVITKIVSRHSTTTAIMQTSNIVTSTCIINSYARTYLMYTSSLMVNILCILSLKRVKMLIKLLCECKYFVSVMDGCYGCKIHVSYGGHCGFQC